MSKIITSFDIGIRNLAYCILEYLPHNLSGNQFKIHDWNVIDLLETVEHPKDPKCQTKYRSGPKTGQICGQLAHYYYLDDCGQKISVCRVHSKSESMTDLKRNYTVANTSLYELARLAINILDKIDFNQSQEIVIESQPSKNPKMKNFSMILLNYFIIRYIVEKPEHAQTLQEVKFINSRNKLTVYDGEYVECKLKGQYARNKFYGKVYCKHLIRHNPERLNFLESFKKKDDLCDSFLQGAWYLLNSYKPITSIPRVPIHDPLPLSPPRPLPPIPPLSLPLQTNTPQKFVLRLKRPIGSIGPIGPQHPIGKEYLKAVKKSTTTMQTRNAYHWNKYRQLKRGCKPATNAHKYTLSNIKYVVDHNQFDSSNNILMSAIRYYFEDKVNLFEKGV
jgi:hypothetical protein